MPLCIIRFLVMALSFVVTCLFNQRRKTPNEEMWKVRHVTCNNHKGCFSLGTLRCRSRLNYNVFEIGKNYVHVNSLDAAAIPEVSLCWMHLVTFLRVIVVTVLEPQSERIQGNPRILGSDTRIRRTVGPFLGKTYPREEDLGPHPTYFYSSR